MTTPLQPTFIATDLSLIDGFEGKLVVFITPKGGLDPLARRVNKLCKGAVARFVGSDDFDKMEQGDTYTLSYPSGMPATAVIILKTTKKTDATIARKAGAAVARATGSGDVMLLAGASRITALITQGFVLCRYDFVDHKTADVPTAGKLDVMCSNPDESGTQFADLAATAQGVFFTRDLVNAPANVLSTTEFASQLVALKKLGIKVTVLEEKELAKLGMN